MIKPKNVKEINDFFTGHEVMVIGKHELTGTITKFVHMANEDGSKANEDDKPSKSLRVCVETAYHKRILLQLKNVFVIAKKQQAIWN